MEGSRWLLALVFLSMALQAQGFPSARRSRASRLAADPDESSRESKLTTDFKEASSTTPAAPTNRKNKALNLFNGFFPSFLSSGLEYEDDDDDVTFSVNDDAIDEEDLSRTIPSSRRPQNKKKNGNGNGNTNSNRNNLQNNYQNQQDINSLQYDNSPIFYIRLPPTPYMFVPGLGYVSQPPSMGPPMAAPGPQVADPFINLPLDFVSNAKPTGVYQWSGAPSFPQVQQQYDPYGGYSAPQQMMQQPQRPSYDAPSYKPQSKPSPTNSKVTNLKGTYNFNGKPGDSVYVLRDTYNSIYSDALQNFYP